MQIIENDDSIRQEAEDTAIAKIRSLLIQKYKIVDELRDTVLYDNAVTYSAKNRVYLDAPSYNTSITYLLNSLVTYLGKVYQCITPITIPEGFTQSNWELLGDQYQLYTAITPNVDFDINKSYVAGDVVFYKNNTYTCIRQILGVYPDDQLNGSYSWSQGVSYLVPSGSINNSLYFTKGDSRNKMIKKMAVDITLYYLHNRIAPRNIPELRVKMYDDSVEELDSFSKGNATLEIPLIDVFNGVSNNFIRYGTINTTPLSY